jgi:hypothetical protein
LRSWRDRCVFNALARYHVLSQGDRREAIFRTDADRNVFLDLLGHTCRRTGWQIHPVIKLSQ